jgi:hypothetical protein
MGVCEYCGKSFAGAEKLCPECLELTAQPTTSFSPVGSSARSFLSKGALPQQDVLCLCVVKGPQVGECFYLEGSHISIGRDPQAQLFLNDMTVSREHATIDRVGADSILKDAGSLNGTYVNGVIEDEVQLHDGDLLQIGTFQLVCKADEGRPQP